MKIELHLSKDFRTTELVQKGIELPERVTLHPPLAELTSEVRAWLVATVGLAGGTIEVPSADGGIVRDGVSYREWNAGILPSQPEDWHALMVAHGHAAQAGRDAIEAKQSEALKRRMAELATFRAELEHRVAGQGGATDKRIGSTGDAFRDLPGYERIVELRQQIDARIDAAEAAHRAAKEEAEAKKEKARARREAEKAEWIAQHGSDFLKRAASRGYDCQRRYIEERSALEFPGYLVDFGDKAQERDRSCPSEAALTEAERMDGEVVWVTRANPDWPHDLPDQFEAVRIDGPPQPYYLYRPFPDQA